MRCHLRWKSFRLFINGACFSHTPDVFKTFAALPLMVLGGGVVCRFLQ